MSKIEGLISLYDEVDIKIGNKRYKKIRDILSDGYHVGYMMFDSVGGVLTSNGEVFEEGSIYDIRYEELVVGKSGYNICTDVLSMYDSYHSKGTDDPIEDHRLVVAVGEVKLASGYYSLHSTIGNIVTDKVLITPYKLSKDLLHRILKDTRFKSIKYNTSGTDVYDVIDDLDHLESVKSSIDYRTTDLVTSDDIGSIRASLLNRLNNRPANNDYSYHADMININNVPKSWIIDNESDLDEVLGALSRARLIYDDDYIMRRSKVHIQVLVQIINTDEHPSLRELLLSMIRNTTESYAWITHDNLSWSMVAGLLKSITDIDQDELIRVLDYNCISVSTIESRFSSKFIPFILDCRPYKMITELDKLSIYDLKLVLDRQGIRDCDLISKDKMIELCNNHGMYEYLYHADVYDGDDYKEYRWYKDDELLVHITSYYALALVHLEWLDDEEFSNEVIREVGQDEYSRLIKYWSEIR